MHALTRALTAVLAVIVLAVPAAASARIDPPTSGASERTQDLRHLAAGGLSPTPKAVFASPMPAPTPSNGVLWSYGYESKAPARDGALPRPGRRVLVLRLRGPGPGTARARLGAREPV